MKLKELRTCSAGLVTLSLFFLSFEDASALVLGDRPKIWRVTLGIAFLGLAGLLELVARLRRRTTRDSLRSLVGTALLDDLPGSLHEAERRIEAAEKDWGPLDLWDEKDALKAREATFRLVD